MILFVSGLLHFLVLLFKNKLYSILTFLSKVVEVLMLVYTTWLITQFKSARKDCRNDFVLFSMCLTIFYGLCQSIPILMEFVIAFIIYPIFICLEIKGGSRRLASGTSSTLIGKYIRLPYDPSIFKHESECGICISPFEEGESVTPLPCDKAYRHYFHSECI